MNNEKLVIIVKDKNGSRYFCGFDSDNSFKSSLLKESAILYDEKEVNITNDIMRITQLSQGNLMCSTLKYDDAPKIEKAKMSIMKLFT